MKYKLIKEYPGSPAVNSILNVNNFENRWVKNYPEFWEEIVEKDYEILSFYYNTDIKLIYRKKEDGLFYTKYNKGYREEIFFYKFVIHSVKRLSDGEIFTVGDYTNAGRLTGFKINGNSLDTKHNPSEEDLNDDYYLKDLKLIKKPLFTTKDGVDIYKDDEYYTVNINTVEGKYYKAVSEDNEYAKMNYINYSTKEAAEEYILMNKPCLSINDIKQLYKTDNRPIIKRAIKLIKSRS